MIVKNNSLLNILIPNENKTLKEVLKEADIKSIQNNKSASIEDVLKNLVDNVTNKTKSTESIQNLLKNSTVFKDLGNFPKELESLVKNLPNDEKLSTAKNTLQSFLTHIKDLDENKLKELVQKSGIFLESKIANSASNPNMAKLTDILMQIKDLIKNDTSPKAKELNTLIDKILTQNQDQKPSSTINQDVKQTVQLLKEIINQSSVSNQSKIVQLTQQLESLNPKVQLADSKLQNTALNQEQKQNIQNDIKPLLANLKTELLTSKQANFEPIIKQLDGLLQSKDMFIKNPNTIEPKALLQQVVQSPIMNQAVQSSPNLQNLVNQLQQQTQQLQTLQNSISNNNISAQKIQELQQQIKSTLTQMQTVLQDVKGIDTKPLMQVIDKLISMPNLFSKIEVPQSLQQQITTGVGQNTPQATTQGASSAQQAVASQVSNQTTPQQTTTATAQNNVQQTPTSNTEAKTQNTTQALNTAQLKVQERVDGKTAQTINTEIKPTQTENVQNKTPLEVKLPSSNETTAPTQNTKLEQQPLPQSEIKPTLNNLSENIKSIITAVKATLAQLQLQNPQDNTAQNFNQFEMQKTIQKMETLFQGKFEQIQQQLMQTNKSPQDVLQEDIKSTLLQLQQESANNPKMQELSKQVDRLLTHIDYYQMLSITSNSNYLYLPFVWDMLEDGSISMKQMAEERYFCEIHLTLKEFGKMDLLLGLYEENHIDISIFSNEEFVKDLIKEHMVELRVGLNRAGLIPQNITVLDLKTEDIQEEPEAIYQHNPYSDDDLGFGVDIKV